MSPAGNSGYGSYEPPKQEKRHPLTRGDTRELYKTAIEYPSQEVELIVRTLLDYGLRCGELEHCRAHWIQKEYKRPANQEVWRIKIPRIEYCYSGKGGSAEQQNSGGANLHQTSAPCTDCVHRNWGEKVNGKHENDSGWITEEEAEKYDWSPKKQRSATKVWQFPGIEETAETAQLLKTFLEGQPNEQWPFTQNQIRRRLDKIVEEADLDLPDRSRDKIVPHGLRHTYGCRLVEMGVGEGSAMKQMRHRNADIFRWYSDVRGTRVVSALNDAATKNDSLLHE